MLGHIINVLLHRKYIKENSSVLYSTLNKSMYKLFKKNGEGLYYSICQAEEEGSSHLIGKFCNGLAHTICILYSKNLKSWFTHSQWNKIKIRWIRFYGSLEGLDNCKTLVIGSADAIGINYCDYSHFQDRPCVMRKVPNELYSKDLQQQVAQWFIEEPYSAIYDFVGIFGNIISNKLIDKKAYYCCRMVYQGFKSMNIYIADHNDPKPNHIHEYNKDWIIFNTLTVLG